jgi:radical SAM superfamily enzyme YgiQ (UPF0313 family)
LIWPPLGLCRIAKFLTDHGYDVQIIEDALNKYDLDHIITATSELDFVGMGAMTIQVPRVEELTSHIRQNSEAVIVCGGPHYSAVRVLPPGCDALVVSDGEQAFSEIINGKRGIVRGESVKEYIEVDFSFIDYLRYGDHLIDGTRAISLLTARGCPFNCKFCGSPRMFGRKVTNYPLEAVVSNMSKLSSRYNIKAFRIMDDTFTVDNKRVLQFCDFVESFQWRMSCPTNIRTIDANVLKRMKEVGFEFVAIGAESADPTVLALANKQQSKDDIRNAVIKINEAGLKAELLFIIGLPGETVKSLSDTIQFVSELKAYRMHAQFFTPFPGCEFHNKIDEYDTIIEHDYRKWTHRTPVFVPHTIGYDDLMPLAEQFFALISRKTGS